MKELDSCCLGHRFPVLGVGFLLEAGTVGETRPGAGWKRSALQCVQDKERRGVLVSGARARGSRRLHPSPPPIRVAVRAACGA